VRTAADGFADVTAAPLTPELCATDAPDDRRVAGYGPLLDLCRLIAAGLAPGIEVGRVVGPSFLVDLEAIWERYVTAGAVAAFADRRGGTGRGPPYLAVGPPAACPPQ